MHACTHVRLACLFVQVGRVKAITNNKGGGQTRLDIKLPTKARRTDAVDFETIKVGLQQTSGRLLGMCVCEG